MEEKRAGDGVRVLSLLSVFALGTLGILAQVVGQSNIERTKSTERPDAWRFLPQEVPPDPPDPREKELLVVRGSDEGNPNLTPLDQPPLNKPAPSPLDQILRADTESQGNLRLAGATMAQFRLLMVRLSYSQISNRIKPILLPRVAPSIPSSIWRLGRFCMLATKR